MLFKNIAVLLLISILISGCGERAPATPGGPPKVVRLGFFANITHAQALIGSSRGDFQKALGSVPLNTKIFNAGPSVVEAIFAGELDIAYIGPSPAINAYVKSKGEAVRVISGSAANGIVIVARSNSGIQKMSDLAGKRIATPRYGNTQDVSARHYIIKTLKQSLKERGGSTEILSIASAEQLSLVRAGEIDAVWAPEPWGARLIHEAGGVLIEEEKNLWSDKHFSSTMLLVSRKFLKEHPQTVAAFLSAHVDITGWINTHRKEAADIVNSGLKTLAGKALSQEVLADAFGRITFTTNPYKESLLTFAQWSYDLKIAREKPDLKDLLDLTLLEKINAGNASR